MNNHANYTRIGFAVFAGVIAIVATLIYLGGIQGKGDFLYAETCYDKPISGLSVGSAVNFRGVKVGEVKEISFIGNKYEVKGADNSRIYILMAFNRKLLNIPTNDFVAEQKWLSHLVDQLGLRATVTASGITGLSRIECDFANRKDEQVPQISWKPRHFYIPPKDSLLDNFSDSATKVMNQINKMDITSVFNNIKSSIESLSQIMESTKVMMDTRQADLETLMGNLTEISSSAKILVEELRENPSLLIRERVANPLSETQR